MGKLTTLKDIGEFGFIKRFSPQFDELIKHDDYGIGDDCALLSISDAEYHLVSTDLLVEDVHFLKNKISPQELGHKALAVNLSDIAAMGGKAMYSFLSIAIPKEIDLSYLDTFMSGYYELSKTHKVALMGGDTTRSQDKLLINVTVIGQCKKADVHLRSMAKVGDIICTTGTLGDSAAGLKALLENISSNNDIDALIKRHHTPQPRLNEGLFLSSQNGVNAMMDISDGVASDLKHILKASNIAANIYTEKLPISSLLKKVATENNWNTDMLTASGGEDYELLLTIDKNQFKKIDSDYFNHFGNHLYPIGEITEGESEITWYKNDKIIDFNSQGFNHFSKD